MSYIEYCKQAEQSLIAQTELTEELIKKLYARNLPLAEAESAISYRTISIEPVEMPHSIAAPEDLPHLMNHYISQVTISGYSLHPIEVAAMAYKRFLDIYPFEKYNEETAISIAGFLLQRSGYYFTGFPSCLMDEYKKAIRQAIKTGMPDDLIIVFAKSVSLI
ncbi:MAG: Fic family protein [Clostridiales bacterium]|nr:Fic family protein [Clostridiales bacterium]